MSFIASAITNPGQLIGLPLTIFQAAFSFGSTMMTQAADFMLSLLKTFA